MRATLEFQIPEESEEHQTAVDGWKWRALVQDMDNGLRLRIKHGTDSGEVKDALQLVRDALHKAADDNGVSVWG